MGRQGVPDGTWQYRQTIEFYRETGRSVKPELAWHVAGQLFDRSPRPKFCHSERSEESRSIPLHSILSLRSPQPSIQCRPPIYLPQKGTHDDAPFGAIRFGCCHIA